VRGRGLPYNRIDDCGAVKVMVYYPDRMVWSGQRLTSQIENGTLTFNGWLTQLTA
jgi:hypothetical protein